jgi:hypothetical protein
VKPREAARQVVALARTATDPRTGAAGAAHATHAARELLLVRRLDVRPDPLTTPALPAPSDRWSTLGLPRLVVVVVPGRDAHPECSSTTRRDVAADTRRPAGGKASR